MTLLPDATAANTVMLLAQSHLQGWVPDSREVIWDVPDTVELISNADKTKSSFITMYDTQDYIQNKNDFPPLRSSTNCLELYALQNNTVS